MKRVETGAPPSISTCISRPDEPARAIPNQAARTERRSLLDTAASTGLSAGSTDPAPSPPSGREAAKRRMTVDFNLEGAEVHVVSPAPTDSGQALSAISSDGVVRRAISSCASISQTSQKSFLNQSRKAALISSSGVHQAR